MAREALVARCHNFRSILSTPRPDFVIVKRAAWKGCILHVFMAASAI